MARRPVYSAAFVEYTPDTPNESFLVPEDYTAVLRYASVVQNIGAYNVLMGIANAEDAPVLDVWQVADIGVGSMAMWEGRVVIPGGGYIQMNVSAAGSSISMYCGGYLLAN